jgi:hypothetical protein
VLAVGKSIDDFSCIAVVKNKEEDVAAGITNAINRAAASWMRISEMLIRVDVPSGIYHYISTRFNNLIL